MCSATHWLPAPFRNQPRQFLSVADSWLWALPDFAGLKNSNTGESTTDDMLRSMPQNQDRQKRKLRCPKCGSGYVRRTERVGVIARLFEIIWPRSIPVPELSFAGSLDPTNLTPSSSRAMNVLTLGSTQCNWKPSSFACARPLPWARASAIGTCAG
jgi:hypothetical protein